MSKSNHIEGNVYCDMQILKKASCPNHIIGTRRKISFYLCKCIKCGNEKIYGRDIIRNQFTSEISNCIICREKFRKIRAEQERQERSQEKLRKKENYKNQLIGTLISAMRTLEKKLKSIENILIRDSNRTP